MIKKRRHHRAGQDACNEEPEISIKNGFGTEFGRKKTLGKTQLRETRGGIRRRSKPEGFGKE